MPGFPPGCGPVVSDTCIFAFLNFTLVVSRLFFKTHGFYYDLPSISGECADLYWHGLGFDESVYSKPGVYAVNKLPGMFEISQKVSLKVLFRE